MGRSTHFGSNNHRRGAGPRLRAAVPSDGVLWRAFLVSALLLGLLVAAGGAGT